MCQVPSSSQHSSGCKEMAWHKNKMRQLLKALAHTDMWHQVQFEHDSFIITETCGLLWSATTWTNQSLISWSSSVTMLQPWSHRTWWSSSPLWTVALPDLPFICHVICAWHDGCFFSLWLRTQKLVMNPENNKSYQSSNHQTQKQIYCEFSNNNIQISMHELVQTNHKICLFLRSLCWHCKSTHNPWNMRLEPSSPGTLSWSSSKLPISCEGTSYVGLEILWGLSVMVPVGKLWRRG